MELTLGEPKTNSYIICKDSIIRYFSTDNGKKMMKKAQKKYLETDKAKEYNRQKALKYYYKQKEFNEEIKRLNMIEIY